MTVQELIEKGIEETKEGHNINTGNACAYGLYAIAYAISNLVDTIEKASK